jgi:hypothetical protein
MTDIDQDRFALMAALTKAHTARPDDYSNPGTLIAMSDEALRAYAVGLLQLLEGAPGGDSVETELQQELRLILHDTPSSSRHAYMHKK